MSSEAAAADQLRPARLSSLAARPSEPEHLSCPRCDSINTKFCYYNNYNLSQPRHFCKSCRRYWTRGGTLRNVPVGGGSRKPHGGASNKRPRRVDPTASSAAETAPPENEREHEHDQQLHATITNPNPQQMMMSGQMMHGSGPMTSFSGCDVNLNEAVPEVVPNFGSYMSGHVNVNMNGGLLPFGGGFGLGLGSGPYGGLGFGLGPYDWATMEPVAGSSHHESGNNDVSHGGENGVGDISGGDGNGSGSGGSSSGGCNTWQMGSGVEGSLNDADCFGWPDLAISMSGKGLK